MVRFKPFQNDSQALNIGGLSVENGRQRISISGTQDLVADQEGLGRAMALPDALALIVAALGRQGNLPGKASPEPTPSPKKVKCSFV